MSNKTRKYEDPVEDVSELGVEEEFRFDLEQARRNVLPRGVRKVFVPLFLDDDVVAHFKRLAAQMPTTSLQAEINQTLRSAMEQRQPRNGNNAVSVLLNNPAFVELLDERITKIIAGRRKAAGKQKISRRLQR